MMRRWLAVLVLSLVVDAFGATGRAFAAGVPDRSASGEALAIPEAHQSVGEVYHVVAGAGTQFSWEADASLLRVVASCNRSVGYVAAPFELVNGEPPLLGGALRVSVASLRTGSEQYDAGLHSAEWLDLAQHPEILVSLVRAGPARNVVTERKIERCEFDLTGELSVKDKTIRFESPASLALLPFSNATQQFSPSDLLMLRTRFSVSLVDIGISPADPMAPDFSGSKVTLELYLMCTTLHPEKNLDPRIKDEWHVKKLAFMVRLRDFDDPVGAYALGRSLMKEAWDSDLLLNDLAWGVLTDEHVRRRDLAFAEEAARRANELTDHKDPTYLSTLARLQYERGDLDGALSWSRKAVEHLPGQPFFVGPPIEAALQGYEAEAKAREGGAKSAGKKEAGSKPE